LKRATVRLLCLLCCLLAAAGSLSGEEKNSVELRVRIVSSLPGKHRAVPAVIWLEPLPGTESAPFLPHGHYTLLQKNRTFIPHLQVLPAGSVVAFPNQDPFFHNVFSLFDGKRFDLGLYEAGSSKSVTFSRSGVSYIFCNIHPEMSAVIITLTTPLFAVANAQDALVLPNIPAGQYRLRFWIEGVPQPYLDTLSRTVKLASGVLDLGNMQAPIAAGGSDTHMNMYGKPYPEDSDSPYSDLP
jgi:hypothetical protein